MVRGHAVSEVEQHGRILHSTHCWRIYSLRHTIHVSERCREKKERSKQATCRSNKQGKATQNRWRIFSLRYTIHVSERCRKEEEERSKQGHTNNKFMLMRDAERRKKEASKVKQIIKQSNTAHPRQSLSQR